VIWPLFLRPLGRPNIRKPKRKRGRRRKQPFLLFLGQETARSGKARVKNGAETKTAPKMASKSAQSLT